MIKSKRGLSILLQTSFASSFVKLGETDSAIMFGGLCERNV